MDRNPARQARFGAPKAWDMDRHLDAQGSREGMQYVWTGPFNLTHLAGHPAEQEA